MREKIKKSVFISLGVFFVALGIIGAFLPILPTTPFLILALFFFAESSPKFHKMLLNNRYFGEDLQRWERDKTIQRTTKVKATTLIVISFALSIFLVHPTIQLQILLVAIALILLAFLWSIKETNIES